MLVLAFITGLLTGYLISRPHPCPPAPPPCAPCHSTYLKIHLGRPSPR